MSVGAGGVGASAADGVEDEDEHSKRGRSVVQGRKVAEVGELVRVCYGLHQLGGAESETISDSSSARVQGSYFRAAPRLLVISTVKV